MKRTLQNLLFASFAYALMSSFNLNAQTLEWRLVNPTFSTAVDPDGQTGSATGIATFTLQIHTVSGVANNINSISVGWSYQSPMCIIPSNPGCTVVSNPANVVLSPEFINAGFSYITVNQCGTATQTTNGRTFDRRTVGTLDGTSINITTAWINVFTVTVWGTGDINTGAGYAVINSSSGGSPAALSTYAVSDNLANEYVVNSQTYSTALLLPVHLSKLEAACSGSRALLNWQTSSESNSDHFDVEKSSDGSLWELAGNVKAFGNSSSLNKYEFTETRNTAVSYYRLRQVDKDGKFTYSPIVKINCGSKSPGLFVYPVPATNHLNIVLELEKNSKINVTLLDAAGKVYQQVQKTLLKGKNQVAMDVSRLSAGQYILKVEEGKNVQTEKIVIR